MAEAEAAPKEEPDTPAEEVVSAFPELYEAAWRVAGLKRKREALEAEEEAARNQLLTLWTHMPDLHGIRLENMDAVRRTWSTKSTPIEPAKLRETLADAPNYIRETVNMTQLRKDYPTVWQQLGKVKTTRTITVRIRGEADASG
ncbi:MAG TPA: hypothetical protein VMG99_08890 [Thermoplasmata archaeon]|nr:hypothetical protein [Thermoplasmata archaeon]